METTTLKAIRYRNVDEAREVLKKAMPGESFQEIFDDDGEEPQGLLSVICEDQLPEEVFCRLFDMGTGTLVEVERIPYEGFGPPAEEEDYMGFLSRKTAYVLGGCRLPVEIESCSFGARDIHHLGAMVLDGEHPVDRDDLATRLDLPDDWDFDDLFDLILIRRISAQEIDEIIHRGIH